MRYITEGVNAIEKSFVETKDKKGTGEIQKEDLIMELLNHIKPTMASTEIEAYIEDKLERP
ncbi:MAG: hypothetical protein ABUK01_09840 [Leptospirales bacterium]